MNKTAPHFDGFKKPESNYFRLPNEWTNITAVITSLAELKVVEYVLRHTWGYQEYDLVKKITTDEFMHGRRGRNGKREDLGTGLSKQAVIDGLATAVRHGLLLVEVDASDKARVKKYYMLRMSADAPAPHSVPENDDSDGGVHHLDPDVNYLDIGVQSLDSRGQPFRHRSEKETKKEFNNVQNVLEETEKGTTREEGRGEAAAHATLQPEGVRPYQNPSHPTAAAGHQPALAAATAEDEDRVAYYAGLIAEKLHDQRSLTWYKIACRRHDPQRLLEKAQEIVAHGSVAQKPGAVFTAWVKTLDAGPPTPQRL